MDHSILEQILVKKGDESFDLNYKIIHEEELSCEKEKNFAWLYSSTFNYLVPLTSEGVDILQNTKNFIECMIRSEEEFENVIYEHFEKELIQKQINNFHEIVAAYKKLDVYYVNENSYILTFNKVEKYKFDTKMQIYSLQKLEILARILNQNIMEKDIKKLANDNYTPIIFPISEEFSYRKMKNNFYTGNVKLSDLIYTGYLHLNDNYIAKEQGGYRHGETKERYNRNYSYRRK